MGKNGYLQKRQAMNQGFLDAGESLGMQKMWDYVQLALRDPDVMGKDVLGRGRLEKIFGKLKELADTYHTAFTDSPEADYYQEKMDAQLREVWGDDFHPFYDRYPQLKQFQYHKPMKAWRSDNG